MENIREDTPKKIYLQTDEDGEFPDDIQFKKLMDDVIAKNQELTDIESHYSSVGLGLYPKEVYAKITDLKIRLDNEKQMRAENGYAIQEHIKINIALVEQITGLQEALKNCQNFIRRISQTSTAWKPETINEIEQLLK